MSKIKTLKYFIDYVERNSISPSESDILSKLEEVLDNEIVVTTDEDGVCCECSTGIENTYLISSYSLYDDYADMLGLSYGCPDCGINSVTNISDLSELVTSTRYFGCKFNNNENCSEFSDNIGLMILGYGTGFTENIVNIGVIEQGKSNLKILKDYLQTKTTNFANQYFSILQNKGIVSTCGYILDTPIISSVSALTQTYTNGFSVCFNFFDGTDSYTITATTTGNYNGKSYYDLNNNTSVIWNSGTSRWECWEYFDTTLGPAGNLYAHLDFPGNEPFSNSQYSWISDSSLLYLLNSNLLCLDNTCVVWGSAAFAMGTIYGIAKVQGSYNGRNVFNVKSYVESNVFDFYLLWNSGDTRWDAWEIFDVTNPNLGPSGDNIGYCNNQGDYPLSSDYYPWVSLFTSPIFVFNSTKGGCYVPICFSYYYNGIGSGNQGNSQVSIYNNKPVYYVVVNNEYTYIVWSNTNLRWEQWSNFSVNSGGYGTLYSYNNEPGNLPISDNYSWVDNSGGQYYITSSTTTIC
jgi:hypothetical protein